MKIAAVEPWVEAPLQAVRRRRARASGAAAPSVGAGGGAGGVHARGGRDDGVRAGVGGRTRRRASWAARSTGEPFRGLHYAGPEKQMYLAPLRDGARLVHLSHGLRRRELARAGPDVLRGAGARAGRRGAAAPPASAPVLAGGFEAELNRNLAALFGRATDGRGDARDCRCRGRCCRVYTSLENLFSAIDEFHTLTHQLPCVTRQLRHPRDHVQDRLLRTGPVRKDDEPALHLRPGARRPERQDGVAGDADRPHAVLRLPAARPRHHLRLHDKFQLYTVPGQVYYQTTRKLVLQGADGVVFVADSQARQLDENIESFQDLHANLAEQGIDARTVPLVMQYNKQDLPRELILDVADAVRRAQLPRRPRVRRRRAARARRVRDAARASPSSCSSA